MGHVQTWTTKVGRQKVGQLLLTHDRFLLAKLDFQQSWPSFVGRLTSPLLWMAQRRQQAPRIIMWS